MKAQVWRLNSYPSETTQVTDFRLQSEELPALREGDALVQVGTFGLAPSLRFRMTPGGQGLPGMSLGDPITASGVGLVLESKSKLVQPSDYVYGDLGWCDYAVIGSKTYLKPIGKQGEPLTNPRGVLGERSPYSAGAYQLEDFLGVLGGVGVAAYIGLFHIGSARAGETVLVTAAAGGIGLIASQLGKIAGLNVIGSTRDRQKADWLREIGLETVVNLSPETLTETLQHLPKLDLLFENVGGAALPKLVEQLKKSRGRVVVCGLISEYESNTTTPLPLSTLVFKDLQVTGFFADDSLDRWGDALDCLGRWLTEGKLSRFYDITEGIEKAAETYLRLYRGATNRGKLLLRVGQI